MDFDDRQDVWGIYFRTKCYIKMVNTWTDEMKGGKN